MCCIIDATLYISRKNILHSFESFLKRLRIKTWLQDGGVVQQVHHDNKKNKNHRLEKKV